MQQLSVNTLRLGVFMALVVLAPMSKFPYIPLPVFNFTSFRLGFYQLLLLLFVALCIVPTIKATKALYTQNKVAFISIITLCISFIFGFFGAYYKARSLLLIASIALLLLVVLCAWWYIGTIKSTKLVARYVLIAAILFSLLGIVQFIIATFSNDTVGLLCTGCTNKVFGFPRINVFAAEPQFFANALLPMFFIAFAAFYQYKTKLSIWALLFTSIAIGLTFSRGAFIAIAAGLLLFIFILAAAKELHFTRIVLGISVVAIAIFVSFTLLVASATYSFKDTPNITYNTVRTMISHLSGGAITLPTKQVVVLTPANPNGVPAAPSVNNGPVIVATVVRPVTSEPVKAPIANDVVEESGQERVTAARLALQAWRKTFKTVLVGVGAGNLGPYVIANIDKTVPNNLTVYIFYILLLAEVGIIGLVAFLVLFLSALYWLIKAYWNNDKNLQYLTPAIILFAFLVQYLFFGSYINVAYIWLWLGIGLGLAGLPLKKAYN